MNLAARMTHALDNGDAAFSDSISFKPEDADTIHSAVDEIVKRNPSLRPLLFMDVRHKNENGILGVTLNHVPLDGTTSLPTTTMRRKHRSYTFVCKYATEVESSEESTEEPSPEELAPMSDKMRAAAMALVE